MGDALWTSVDDYFENALLAPDAALDGALAAAHAAGLPPIQVSPLQGKFLYLLARLMQARRVLEIGTLGGYSTIWLGRAVAPHGRVVTLEIDPRHAQVARASIQAAELAQVVEVRVGAAIASLERLIQERGEPFDLVFIDADKENIAAYVEQSIRLCRPGAAIVVDNVVRGGHVTDAASTDVSVQGVRRFCEQFGRDPRLTVTALQTTGRKGYDGFAMAIVSSQ